MINATRGEIERMPLPGLLEVIWSTREYLGWIDPRTPLRGHLVHWREGQPVGVMLRAAEGRMSPGISAQCSLCRTSQPAHQVRLFSAARAGQAGRDGNSVATYICADLACSHIIRILPPVSELQPEPAAVVTSRADALLARVTAFTAGIRGVETASNG
ncbi:MAG: FBP domain-containing protein [Microbacteriaceae bacterium]|nr:FBP domain-containing protein [Microbacteriaceae bacterium]